MDPSRRQPPRGPRSRRPSVLSDATIVAFAPSTDLDRAHEFYGGVLGLPCLEATPFANVYDANGTTLRVTRVQQVATAPYTVLGWSVRDIHASIAALTARGVEVARFEGIEQDEAGVWTAPDGARIAWFHDPDGSILSLTQPSG
jgi:predicted enzyme related to lactoylglutathione lyase